ncbi:MAG: hypothetical protein RR777_07605, partial [Christensenellaceae bacterium]
KCDSIVAQVFNSFVALFKKVPKTGCRPMATYSVDERRPRCMDSFGGLRVDRTVMKSGRESDEVHGFLWGLVS